MKSLLRSTCACAAIFLVCSSAHSAVLAYDGFPNSNSTASTNTIYSMRTSTTQGREFSDATMRTVVHPSHIGFNAANVWGGGTSTVCGWWEGLSYTDPAGAPQVGSALCSYQQNRSLSRTIINSVSQAQAERGVYMSGLVRWTDAEFYDMFGGYCSEAINGANNGNFGNQYGAFVGFVNTGATDGDPRNLVVRYRTGGGTFADSVLIDNITMGTDYFVVVKMVQGIGGPDKIFAQAYSSGSYPVQAPASWTIGGSDGLDAQCLNETGNGIDTIAVWGQGDGTTAFITAGDRKPGGLVDELILGEFWKDVVPSSADSTNPTVLAPIKPADDESDATMTGLVLGFSEPVLLGPAGNITIDHLAGGTDIVFDVTTAAEQLEVFHNQLIIHPAPGLISGEPYSIKIDAGAVVDEQGNAFAGIADDTTWNFDLRLLAYDGFPVPPYVNNGQVDDTFPIHSSMIGFVRGNGWGEIGGATSTIRGQTAGLSYTDPNGSPQAGSISTVYRNDRGGGRIPAVKVGQAQAEAGIYMSGLVRWVSAELTDGMAGYVSEQINGADAPNFNNKRGAFIGFTDPAPPSGQRDLIVRYRNTGGVSTDSIIIPNITMGTDYFVVVNMVQGNGTDDRIFAEAYSAGSYPTQAPTSWTVGGTAGIASNCLAEGGADNDDIDALVIWGGATGAGGVNACVAGCAAGGQYDELYLGEVWQDVVPAAADSANPTVANLSPADNSLAADASADLVITFDEPVFFGIGNITIVDTNQGASTTIDVTAHGGQLTLFHNQLTIAPPAGLGNGGSYAVLIDATAIDDEHGNSFAGITDTADWNFTTNLLIRDGFPAAAYADVTAFSDGANDNVTHASILGFTASNTFGGGTSTLRAINSVSLAYSDPAGAPQAGSAAILYRQNRGLARDFAPSISQGAAEAGIYISGLVRWTNSELSNAFAGFTDVEMNGTPTFTPQNHPGAFFGFVADGANRDLVLRVRTSATTYTDEILVNNMVQGTDYFVIAKLVQGAGEPDLLFANAYSAGSYPVQPPTSWTVGGSTGVSGEFLDEGGGNAMTAMQMWGGGGPNSWVGGACCNPGAHFDELTLALRWADVVPNAGDSTAPTIIAASFNPADGSTGVTTATSLTCEFDEEILLGSGNITLDNLSGGADIIIDVTAHASQLAVKGTSLTINPNGVLDGSSNYAVQFAAGSITDIASNNFAGIADTTTWNFQTALPDTTLPTISALDPADNEAAAPLATALSVTFDEDIQAGSGNIEIRDLGDGSDTRIFAASDLQVSIAGAVLTINPSTAFEHSEDYSVRIGAGAIEDLSSNAFAGIANDTTWNFTTLTPDIKVASGAFITPGATGGFSVTGVGFQPKALMVWTSGSSGPAAEPNFHFSQGFTDGTNQFYAALASKNDAVSLQRRQDVDDLLAIFDDPGMTLSVHARLTSFDADGFTLNFSAQAAGHIVHYVAFGGDQLTASAGQVRADALSATVGFRPDLCFTACVGFPSGTRADGNGLANFGAFDGSLNQWINAGYVGTGGATHQKDSILNTDRFVGQFWRAGGPGYNWYSALTGVNATGFTWNLSGSHGDDVFFYLALNLGGFSAAVGDFTKETSGVDGVTQLLPDLGFVPGAYGLASASEVDEVLTTRNDVRLSHGVVSGSFQSSATATGEDLAINEHARSQIGSALGIATVGANIQAEAHGKTIRSSTPALIWSPNNSQPYIIGYWAIETTNAGNTASIFRFR